MAQEALSCQWWTQCSVSEVYGDVFLSYTWSFLRKQKMDPDLQQKNGLSEQRWNQLNDPDSILSWLIKSLQESAPFLGRKEQSVQWRQEDKKSLGVGASRKMPKAFAKCLFLVLVQGQT